MRGADIKIGSEYALTDYGSATKVKVVEKGLLNSSFYGSRADGVRYVIVASSRAKVGAEGRTTTRKLEPWTTAHEARLRDARAFADSQRRVERIAARLQVTASLPHGMGVWIPLADFLALAERLGVGTD